MNLYLYTRFSPNLHNFHTKAITDVGFSDIKSLISYNKNTNILDNLISKFNSIIKNKISIDKDIYSLLYNKELYDIKELLLKYPELKPVKKFLYQSIHMNNGKLNLQDSIEILISLINNHNSTITIPGKTSLTGEKIKYLNWMDYNTPTYKNCKITPSIGTAYPRVDLSDESPSSIYQQWVVAVLFLTIEFIVLSDCKKYLEDTSDLEANILDIKNRNTIYWINRQLAMLEDIYDSRPEGYYLPDYFSNKHLLYREVSEDLTYVLLNLILGQRIIAEFKSDQFGDSDIFFSKLTEIIKEHYTIYDKEYKYLDQLKWLYANNYISEHTLKSQWSTDN